jgi:hypothetical protein
MNGAGAQLHELRDLRVPKVAPDSHHNDLPLVI